MKTLFPILFALALLITACAPHPHDPSPAPLVSKHNITGADAIAIVHEEIRHRGGDPSKEECSVKKSEEGWDVLVWHIYYPHNVGSSRFVPGGHTIYVVSVDGKILRIIPGL